MRHRILTRMAVLVAAVLTFGTIGFAAAGAASASTGAPQYGHVAAGFQAGSGGWRFRFVDGNYYQPGITVGDIAECALLTSTNNPNGQLTGKVAGELTGICTDTSGGSHYAVAICPTGGGGGTHTLTLLDGNGHTVLPEGGDPMSFSTYYDQGSEALHFQVNDNNTADPGVATWQCANDGSIWHGAFVGDADLFNLTDDTGTTVTSFSYAPVTSYNGTRGHGMNGGWVTSQVNDGDPGQSLFLTPVGSPAGSWSLVSQTFHFGGKAAGIRV